MVLLKTHDFSFMARFLLIIGAVCFSLHAGNNPISHLDECYFHLMEANANVPNELMEEVPLDPSEMNYRIYGAEHSETLVMIHGLCGDLRTFDSVAQVLAKYYRVVTYDQRGQGCTANFSSGTLAKDLKGLLDHLQIRSVHILGHSLGARTALRFAHLYPERIKSVIVEDMEFRPRTIEPAASAIQANAESFECALASLRVPLLVLAADPKHCRIVTPEAMRYIHGLMPEAVLQVIPDATHDIHNSQREAYLKAVGVFLEEVVTGKRKVFPPYHPD